MSRKNKHKPGTHKPRDPKPHVDEHPKPEPEESPSPSPKKKAALTLDDRIAKIRRAIADGDESMLTKPRNLRKCFPTDEAKIAYLAEME